jgi:hypothetical protein
MAADDIYDENERMTERRWNAFIVGKEHFSMIAVYSVHTECLDWNAESGKRDLFGITTGAKSAC